MKETRQDFRQFSSTYTAMLVLAVYFVPARCAADEPLFEKALASPRHVNSYEFSCREVDLTKQENSETGDYASNPTVTTWFYQSGDMYRVNTKLGAEFEPEGRPYQSMAFNGEHFQNFSLELDTLSFSRANRFPNPYLQTNPLTLMYMWVTGEPGIRWHELREPKNWRLLGTAAKGGESQVVNGFTCDVFEVSTDGKFRTKWSVYVAKEMDWLPVRMAGKNIESGEAFQLDVLKTASVSADEGNVICPISVRLTETDPARSFRRITSWEFVPDTWRINHSIPLDTFTISPSIAKHVDDFDANFKKHFPESSPPPTSSSSWRTWFVLANVIVVIGLLLAFFLRSRRASRG